VKDALQLMVGDEAIITVHNNKFTVTLSEETYRYPIEMFSYRYENSDDIEKPEPEMDLKTRLMIKHGRLDPPKPKPKTAAEEQYCEANNWVFEKSGMTLEEAIEFIFQYRSVLYHPPVA
jgi:hypothetical protein